jgi:sporulation protein YlmC with PRC-barrel domain
MLHRRTRYQLCLALPLAMALTLPAGTLAAQDGAAPEEPLQVEVGSVSIHSMLEIDVLTADDENLGEVYDVIADPTDGLLTFLVVESTEEILGIIQTAETRVAVPWHRVSLRDSPRQFVLDMTLDEFERLPPWEGERTEGGAIGAAPIDERPDQPAMATD